MFAEVIEDYTAGNPQEEEERWVSLRPSEVSYKLKQRNFEASLYIIEQLLKNAGLRKRKYLKGTSLKNVAYRDEQFEKIHTLKESFLEQGMPVISMDTKSKELIGNFYRDGHYYAERHRLVNDHDFSSYADAILVPHGLYDLANNKGYLSLGTSKDTSSFACDNLEAFWHSHLSKTYAGQDWLLLLCDGGGSNNSRHYIVKQDFYTLAQKLDINIVVAHYPPYCSKWNPIEHRLFCHIHRAWQGAVFHSVDLVKELAEMTSTSTGLQVVARINNNTYKTKRPVDPQFRQYLHDLVQFDPLLPQWNYSFLRENQYLIL